MPHGDTSAEGGPPVIPQGAGGEAFRTRSFVLGELHRPGGTGFLGMAFQQKFDVFVTVFYGQEPPEGYSVTDGQGPVLRLAPGCPRQGCGGPATRRLWDASAVRVKKDDATGV